MSNVKSHFAVAAAALIAACLSVAPSPSIPNPNDLGNGWYNLPPVSQARLGRVIDCLTALGAPPNPTLIAGETTRLNGDLPFAPTVIAWKRGGTQIETDAVMTYFGPSVAYNDLARAFGLPHKIISCPEEAVPKVIEITSPLGTPYPEKCAHCFRSSGANDQFKGGATFVDSTGSYVKRESFFAFIRQPYWERVAAPPGGSAQ